MSVTPQLLELEKIQAKLGHYVIKTRKFLKVEGYIILVQQLKEHIAKGSIYCICKNQYQNAALQSSKNFNFENSSPGPAMAGPIVDSTYVKMPSTFSVHFAEKISKIALLQNTLFAKTNLKQHFSPSECLTFEIFSLGTTMVGPAVDT